MGWTLDRRLRAAAVCAGLASAAALAPSAQAAFEPPFTDPCAGSSILGRGASFQISAQQSWIGGFSGESCTTWPGDGKTVTYEGLGSGSGRTAFGGSGTRDANVRFAATDEAPTPAQEAAMEAGSTATTADDAVVRTIPVAAGPVTVIVNYPDGCTIPTASQFRPDTTNNTTRLLLSNARVEKVFFGDPAFDTWGELVPNLAGIGGKTDAQCRSQAVRRVVRLDNSGTTFAFKQWLKSVDPSHTWEEPALANNQWPNDSGNVAVLRGTGNGNPFLADKVNETDGSIGYGDLAIARTKGFDMTACASPCAQQDTTFWLALANTASPPRRQEPTVSPLGYRNGAKGGNCRTTIYDGIPAGADPTLGNWFNVSGVAGSSGYPICTLTYVLAWDDYADAYGTSSTEQARARSVKDYLTYITGVLGQDKLEPADYSRVPDEILDNIARPGVQAVGWNK